MVTYAVATPAEYVDILEPGWRRDRLLELRALIRDMAPDWAEVISHGMLGYGPAGKPTLHLNAQKTYVALYVGDVAKVDPDSAWLASMDHGKSCVRFKRKDAVGAGAREFLKKYLALKAAGIDLGC